MWSPQLAAAADTKLTFHEALSGITGNISIAAWIFLLIPQLLENYRAQSSAGLSKLFLAIWLAGDVCNLVGALWAGLVPTVVALAVYFCLSDTAIVTQVIYYEIRNRGKGEAEDEGEEDGERRPLLRRLSSGVENAAPPGSGRRASFKRTANGGFEGIPENPERQPRWRSLMGKTGAVLGVCAIGAAAWAIAYAIGWWKPVPVGREGSDDVRNLGAELVGYASAVLYLGARLPQIAKNWKEQSCEGLSILFFIFSLMGNAGQGATILFHSVEKEYFLKNLPWLIGSLGTIAEDVTIFVQFRMYNRESRSTAVE